VLSQETSYRLKAGDRLDRAHAPAVAGRGFTITATFSAEEPRGVIVAQGGTARGYALFVEDGKLVFLVRAGGQATRIASERTVRGVHTAVARIDRSGALSLAIDGQPAASGRAPGLIGQMPVDGLEVGRDEAGLVGPYTADNRFRGTIESVRIELD